MTFEQVYQTYSPKVYRLCRGYVGDADWAKDLTQEVFISIWQALPAFRGDAAVSTWVFRIATNACLRQLAREQRRPARPTASGDLPEVPASLPETATDERLAKLYYAIGTLPETDRLLIGLVLEGLPQAEIAAVLGIADGNARVRIHRVKERITATLRKDGILR